MNISELVKSKRFWAAAATIAVVVLKDKTPLTEDQIQQLAQGSDPGDWPNLADSRSSALSGVQSESAQRQVLSQPGAERDFPHQWQRSRVRPAFYGVDACQVRSEVDGPFAVDGWRI